MVKICQNCGAIAVDDRSKFCTKCGTQHTPAGNPLLCSTCGAAFKLNSAYCPECKTIYPLDKVAAAKKAAAEKWSEEELIRKEETEKAAKLQRDIAKENLIKLRDSGNIQLVHNFSIRYPHFNINDKSLSNLNTLLRKKGIILTDFELVSAIVELRTEEEFEYVKMRVLHDDPKSSDECIKNYIEVFGTVSKAQFSDHGYTQKSRRINCLIKILKDNFSYQGNFPSDFTRIEKQIELEKFENSLIGDQISGKRITINDIDEISGYAFERVLKGLFEKMGYLVIHTTLSNDQGADLIVEKFGVKTVVQAKNWQNNVTNSGIQEVVAAIKHYDAHRAMVISSSGFTQSAQNLAQSNNVVLWDRSILSSMLDENPIFRD